jgi:hypothetical protein
MLALGLSTLAERAYRGSAPAQPSALRDPQLSDPFRGQPFDYSIASNGAELTFWSVGEDFRDDNASDNWSGPAPKDITLHFPLGPRDAKLAKRQ